MKFIVRFLFVFLFFSMVSKAQTFVSFGVNTGVWTSNGLANLRVHAFRQNESSGFTNPIDINNRFYGLNVEFRKMLGHAGKFAWVSSWNLHRNVFSGGGDSAGFTHKFKYKVRLNYFQLMGVEYIAHEKIAVGASVDAGIWRILYKWDRPDNPVTKYTSVYGPPGTTFQHLHVGVSEWVRYRPKDWLTIMLKYHHGVPGNETALRLEGSYQYNFRNISLSLFYTIGK